MSWILLPPPTLNQRLDVALIESLSQRSPAISLSRNQAKRLIESAQVRLNGHAPARSSHMVTHQQPLELSAQALSELQQTPQHAPQPRPPQPQRLILCSPQLELTAQDLLYEDDAIIAINKPSGLTSHQTLDPSRDHLIAALTRYMMRRTQDREPPYLALHHRLDVETSGVIVFSKARSANRTLMESFQLRLAKKQYLALVSTARSLNQEWFIEDHLALAPDKQRMISVLSGGDWAKTSFEVISQRPGAALVSASPKTGRRHQIRAHLSAMSAPILGDALYDGLMTLNDHTIARVMLHAHELTLPHPHTGQPITIHAPIPEDMRALIADLKLTL